MSFEGLRGYAQAANDLSAIARARLLETVREAVRAEVERVGVAVGLASAEEVAALKRSVDRLQRRVALLEGAAPGTAHAASSSGAGGPDTSARPARRPSAARARATSRSGVGGRPPAGAPHSTRPSAPAGPPTVPDAPVPDAPAPEAPQSTTTAEQPGTAAPQRRPSARAATRRRPTAAQARADAAADAGAASGEASGPSEPAPSQVTPVRRPRKADAGSAAHPEDRTDDGQNSGGRP